MTGLCLIQQMTGMNVLNFYSETSIEFVKDVSIAPIIFSFIKTTSVVLCFALIDSMCTIFTIAYTARVEIGRKKIMLMGSTILFSCLVLIQILVWIKDPFPTVY